MGIWNGSGPGDTSTASLNGAGSNGLPVFGGSGGPGGDEVALRDAVARSADSIGASASPPPLGSLRTGKCSEGESGIADRLGGLPEIGGGSVHVGYGVGRSGYVRGNRQPGSRYQNFKSVAGQVVSDVMNGVTFPDKVLRISAFLGSTGLVFSLVLPIVRRLVS